jgi:hypothetical protein
MSSCDSIVKTNLIFGGCKLFVSLHLNDWLDLSLNHSLPSYLLILSRYLTTVLRISLVERHSDRSRAVEGPSEALIHHQSTVGPRTWKVYSRRQKNPRLNSS